jgi:wyosine [tRNA(Phe)-imidazoG37] synthetase (radical SAM superfamily)
MKYIFGPVKSRRLGVSLGVEIIPKNTCSFDCIYCQAGRTINKTIERKPYVSKDEVLSELKEYLQHNPLPDFITLSGTGEPTLNSEISSIIQGIKSISSVPVAVITNSSLLSQVSDELIEADVIMPSLDTVNEHIFKVLNQPYLRLNITEIIQGLYDFSHKFKGMLWLEIMLVKGINDTLEEICKLRRICQDIRVDRICLNTVVRTPAQDIARPLNVSELQNIKDILGLNEKDVCILSTAG